MVEIERCKYLLPCGYCDKYDIPCKVNKVEKLDLNLICDHDWCFDLRMVRSESPEYSISHDKYICNKCGEVKWIDKRWSMTNKDWFETI